VPWGKHKTPEDLEDELYAAEERQMQMEGNHEQQTFTQPQLASLNPYDKVEKGRECFCSPLTAWPSLIIIDVVDDHNRQNTGT
jgi:hypothetical protein